MLKFLNRWTGSIPAPEPIRASVPDGVRVYAIGDIHGRLDLLEELFDQISEDSTARGPATTRLVFLGDLIDRGPDSAKVVERIRQLCLESGNVDVLTGNHEEVFLLALDGDIDAMRMFVRIGGRETILSYGISEDDIARADYAQLCALAQQATPDTHIQFLKLLPDVIEIGDYAFVHAGIRPGLALVDQALSDLRWIRGGFLNHEGDFGKIIVHGHTVTRTVDERHNRIGIDTGAFRTGRLTALGLQGSKRWYLSTEPEGG
ncbi:MAG: metallophosphoesterase family protein [Sphingomonas sp.]